MRHNIIVVCNFTSVSVCVGSTALQSWVLLFSGTTLRTQTNVFPIDAIALISKKLILM